MAEDYSQGWIDLGTTDMVAFIRTVHRLSSAQGLGFRDDKEGPLPDVAIRPYVDQLESGGRTCMDYIAGRSIKMSIHKHDGRYFIRDDWYDHSDAEFDELLARFGFSRTTEKKHGRFCQCDDCIPNNPVRDPDKAPGLCEIHVQDLKVNTGHFDRETNS